MFVKYLCRTLFGLPDPDRFIDDILDETERWIRAGGWQASANARNTRLFYAHLVNQMTEPQRRKYREIISLALGSGFFVGKTDPEDGDPTYLEIHSPLSDCSWQKELLPVRERHLAA